MLHAITKRFEICIDINIEITSYSHKVEEILIGGVGMG